MAEAAAVGLPVPGHPVARPSATVAAMVAQCHRVGRNWRLVLRNRSVLVEDSIGMVHLAMLIANPRQEIQAADLSPAWPGSAGRPAKPGQPSMSWTTRRSRSTGAG